MKVEGRSFIRIAFKYIQHRDIYPFHLFIYNKENKIYRPFLVGNTPLTGQMRSFLLQLLNRGGVLCIDRNQKQTFLHFINQCQNRTDGIESMAIIPPQKYRQLQSLQKKLHRQLQAHFNIDQEVGKAVSRESFYSLIKRARMEIMAYSSQISPSLSMASMLAKQLLIRDTPHNRIIALTYFLAIKMDIDEYQLGELLLAAFFIHLKYTQYPIESLKTELSQQKGPALEYLSDIISHLNLEVSPHIIDILKQTDQFLIKAKNSQKNINTSALILATNTRIIHRSRGHFTHKPLSTHLAFEKTYKELQRFKTLNQSIFDLVEKLTEIQNNLEFEVDQKKAA